jgi:murein DD-endopeptidase MepM/ murein hydrolase activator NlpD
MIYAAASGTVTFAGFGSAANGYGGYGNVVVIKNSTTYSTLYAHWQQV